MGTERSDSHNRGRKRLGESLRQQAAESIAVVAEALGRVVGLLPPAWPWELLAPRWFRPRRHLPLQPSV